jgi:hypothetical protein
MPASCQGRTTVVLAETVGRRCDRQIMDSSVSPDVPVSPGVPASPGVPVSPVVFALVRSADPSGVSGVGVVAWGVRFADGRAVTQWTGETTGIRQIMVWDSIDDIETIHGHGGATRIVFAPG